MARTRAARMAAARMLGCLLGPLRTPVSSHAPRILVLLSAPSEPPQERPSARQARSEKTLAAVDARYSVRCVSGGSTSASTAAAWVAATPSPLKVQRIRPPVPGRVLKTYSSVSYK